jgi:hypothetical protein
VIAPDEKGKFGQWWTFGGLRANASIAEMMAATGGYIPRFDNYSVEIPASFNILESEEWLRERNTSLIDKVRADSEPPGRVKFWECVPSALQRGFMESRFRDKDRAMEILSEPRLYVASSDEPAQGV